MLFTIVIMGGLFVIFDSYTRDWTALTAKAQVVTKEVYVDNLGKKVEEIQNEAMDALRQCESRGHKEEDGIIIFDSNNEASIGRYQFQRKTVVYYYKTLYNQVITPKEAVMIALDDDKARKLASEIIFGSDEKGWRNWFNCANETKMPETIKLLARLQD